MYRTSLLRSSAMFTAPLSPPPPPTPPYPFIPLQFGGVYEKFFRILIRQYYHPKTITEVCSDSTTSSNRQYFNFRRYFWESTTGRISDVLSNTREFQESTFGQGVFGNLSIDWRELTLLSSNSRTLGFSEIRFVF